MRKKLLLLLVSLTFVDNAIANDNYPDDDVVPSISTSSPTPVSSEINERISTYGFGFFSYKGGENYGLSTGIYSFNGLGFSFNIRSNWKFKDHQNTYNADFLLNFSFGVYSNEDVMVLITPEIGPSLATRDEYDGNKFKNKWYCDGFLGIKATVAYKKIVLSAGYHAWAPKWKFKKDDGMADGFYAQIGVSF